MLECIRHRAKDTGETNAKLHDGQNNRQIGKTPKETSKTEKGK